MAAAGTVDPAIILTQDEPLSGSIEAFEAFDRRGEWLGEGGAGAGVLMVPEPSRRSTGQRTTRNEDGWLDIDPLEFQQPPMDDVQYQPKNAGVVHFCFEVDDLDAVRDRMEDVGIEFTGPTHTVGQEDDGADAKAAGARFVYFDGPDGEHLDIIEPKGPFVRSRREQL